MVQIAQYLSATDPPITYLHAGYTGRAAVSERERPQEETNSLPLAAAHV